MTESSKIVSTSSPDNPTYLHTNYWSPLYWFFALTFVSIACFIVISFTADHVRRRDERYDNQIKSLHVQHEVWQKVYNKSIEFDDWYILKQDNLLPVFIKEE